MEEVFTKRDLMMFLNEVKREGVERFTVEEPFFETTLLEVEVSPTYYDLELSGKDRFGPYPDSDKYWDVDDVPDFYDYKDCLISSTLIPYSNWDRFTEWLGHLYKSETDPTLSSRSVFLSIDTNMAFYRLISRNFPIEANGESIQAADFDYLLSSIVESEIDHHISSKYNSSDLKMMGLYTDIGDIRFNFRNRGKLMTRKAKFATQELNFLRGELNAARVKGSPSKTDSEKNDIRIVESLEKFSWSKNIVVALISSDRNMGNHAENSEIPYFVLEQPHRVPKEQKADEGVMLNLLHDLALSFGAVKLPELETTLFGIWGGKTDGDYRDEGVKAWINPNSAIEEDVKKDLKLINSLTGPRSP